MSENFSIQFFEKKHSFSTEILRELFIFIIVNTWTTFLPNASLAGFEEQVNNEGVTIRTHMPKVNMP